MQLSACGPGVASARLDMESKERARIQAEAGLLDQLSRAREEQLANEKALAEGCTSLLGRVGTLRGGTGTDQR